MAANSLKMAWRFLRIDWRSGELQLLFAALLLAVTVVSGLSGFVGRLQLMLAGESSQFLAADRRLQSPNPIAPPWLIKAKDLGLKQAKLTEFQSMLYVDDEPLLVSVKAVSSSYPLVGKVTLRDSQETSAYTLSHGPARGEVWAERRVFQQLGVSLGSRLFIGDAELRLTKVLVAEPDRGAGFISLGPRVLMHQDDVAATNVVTVGSRIKHIQLFSGPATALADFEKWLKPQLSEHERWFNLSDSQPSVATALDRARTFFLLASSIVVVLAVIAIGMASHRYCLRHVKHIAVLKTLGATARYIRRLYSGLLLLLFVSVSILGCLLAALLQYLLLSEVASTLDITLPPMTLEPFVLGVVTAFISLLAFTLPVLAQLNNIAAVRIFQQSKQFKLGLTPLALSIAFVGLLALLLLYTEQLLLSVILLFTLVIVLTVVMLPARLVLKYLPTLGSGGNSGWAMALTNLRRRLSANALQLALFSISLMLLVALIGVRDNLFNQWQTELPEGTPNFFLVNVQPTELQAVEQWVAAQAIKTESIYPMIRGRLTEVNGTAVRQRVSKDSFQRSGADREMNLSWSDKLPPDNIIVDGQWQPPASLQSSLPQVSVESQLAEKLQLKVGDKLTFMIAATPLEAQIGSLRKVDWQQMRPNFYMLLPKKVLQPFPHTLMTSFYLPDSQHDAVVDLLRAVPTAVVIEVDSMIKQIRSIVGHVSLALQWVLVFVVLGSLLVLVATVQQSLDQRKKENTVIRALGGTKKRIVGSLIAEFSILGFIAGVLANIGAEAILMALQYWVMALPVQLHPDLWYIAPLLGVSIVGSAGFLAASRVTRVAPMQLLREA